MSRLKTFKTILQGVPTPVQGHPIKLEGPEWIQTFPLFGYKDSCGWHIVEAASGHAMSTDNRTLKSAKVNATTTLFRVGEDLFLLHRANAITSNRLREPLNQAEAGAMLED